VEESNEWPLAGRGGKLFKQMHEMDKFIHVVAGNPLPSDDMSKAALERDDDQTMQLEWLWLKTVEEAVEKTETICSLAEVDFEQDDLDRLLYFALELRKALRRNPFFLIAQAETTKRDLKVDISDSRNLGELIETIGTALKANRAENGGETNG